MSATVAGLLILAIVLSILPGSRNGAFAGTYTFLQTGWDAAGSANNASHAGNNDTGWTKYASKDANVDTTTTVGSVTLAATSGNETDTTTAQFDGTNSNTTNTGDKIQLGQTSSTSDKTQTDTWSNGTYASNTQASADAGSVVLTTSAASKTAIYAYGLSTGSLGGRSGANTLCQNSANKPDGATYPKAFLSVSATDEIRDMQTSDTDGDGYTGPYPSASPVFWYKRSTNTFTQFTSSWANMLNAGVTPISPYWNSAVLDTGGMINSWTGSNSDGSDIDYNCTGWTTTGGNGEAGRYQQTGTNWLTYASPSCTNSANATGILCIALVPPTYNTPGVYVNKLTADPGTSYTWNSFTPTTTLNGGSVSFVLATSPTTDVPSFAGCGSTIAGNSCIHSTDRDLFYQATLTSASPYTATPSLDSVSANVTSVTYQTSGTYTSSSIDAGRAVNWGALDYSTSGSGATIAVKARSDADGVFPSGSGNTWDSLANAPASVTDGGAMVYPGSGDYIYAASGGSAAFWAYSISNNNWTTFDPTNAPSSFSSGSSLVYPGSGDYIYATKGGGVATFWAYSISNNNWTAFDPTDAPASVSGGGSLVYPGSGDYIYALRGNDSAAFWVYSISNNNWTTFDPTDAPASVSGGGSLVYPGSGDYIYALRGWITNTFWAYSISNNNWTTFDPTDAPSVVSNSSSVVYPGSGDYIYALRGSGSANFWAYSISNNNWTTFDPTDAPASVANGGAMVYPGSGDYMYVTRGGNQTAFWRYNFNRGWDGCSAIVSGADSSTGGCVTDGHQYIQYQAAFTGGNGTGTPSLDDITLNYAYYASDGKLISSAFDTGDQFNSVSGLTWTDSGTGASRAKFQIRTAPNSGSAPDWANGSKWCGPTTCSATSGDTDYAADYYTTSGTGINAINADKAGDQWMQYAMFLPTDGISAPKADDASLQYNFNEAPYFEAGQTTAAQQADGTVNIGYKLKDMENGLNGAGNVYAGLFYQPSGMTLNTTINDASGTGNIILNNPTNFTFATSGTILIDNELIAYTGVTNNGSDPATLTGISRGKYFDDPSTVYPSVAATHAGTAAIFVKANDLSGSLGVLTGITTNYAAKTGTWTPAGEAHLNGRNLTGMNLKVVTDDGYTLSTNRIRSSESLSNVAVDLQAPTITNISSDKADGTYKAGEVIDIDLIFSENITTTGTVTVTLETGDTDRTCTFNNVNNASTATCDYTVQAGDTTNDLDVNPVAGTIKDQFGNTMTNFVPSTNLAANKALAIDTTAPTVDITYSIDHPVKTGDTLVITAIFDEPMLDSPVPKIVLSGGNTLAATNMTKADTTHYTYTRTVGAGNGTATVALSVGTDAAGNVIVAAPTSGADFIVDNTAPTDPGKAALDAYLNNTGNQTVSWTQTTETNFKDYLIQRKTGTGGTFETIKTETDIATTSYVDDAGLDTETYYYRVIAEDTAGNSATGATSDVLTVDKIAPTLDSFTSTTADSDPNDPNTWKGTNDQINIQAVFDEDIASGSTMEVALTVNGNPHVTLDQVVEGNKLSGTYTVVQGQNSTDLGITSIVSTDVDDTAGNNQTSTTIPPNENLSDNKEIYIDTTGPELESFFGTAGAYKAGDDIEIRANYNKTVKSGGTMTVNLNTNHSLTLTTGSNRTYLAGIYTVQSGDNTQDLKVSSISEQAVIDLKNNPLTSTDMPASNLTDIIIDNVAPAAVFADNIEAGPVQSEVMVINVTEINPASYEYGFSSDDVCNGSDTYTHAFSSGETITFNDEENNGKYVCIRLVDRADHDVYLASSNRLDVDVTAPFADSVLLDRSANNDQLQFNGVADKNADGSDRGLEGLEMRIQALPGELDECDLSASSYADYASAVTLGDISSVLKVCAQLKDQTGNESQVYSTYTPENPANFKATDISNLLLTPPFRGVFLTWQIPSAIGEGGIDYFEVKECDTSSDVSSCDPDTVISTIDYAETVQNYEYKHNDLEADTKYCYNVRFKDNHGNYSKYSSTKCIVPGLGEGKLTTITMLYNDGGQAGDPKVLTDNKAVIAFDTDQPAKCIISYGTSQGPDNYTEVPVSESDYNINHSIHLPGLIFSTKYYYQINCADAGNNAIAASEYSFTTLEKQMTEEEANADNDTTAPEISNVSLTNITGESATVTWETDEKSNSLVKFGIDPNFGNMAGNDAVNVDKANFVSLHSVIINNLIPATKYYFAVISYDISGNIGQSSESSFTTKAPSSLSSVKVVSKNLNQAIVTWETDASTTSVVEYGLTTAYGDKKESSSRNKTHEIVLTGLESKKTYHFRVKGTDSDGNLYASSDNTFEPKSPPQIDSIKVSDTTEHGTGITFATDVPTDALVTYMDLSNAENTGSQGKPDLTSNHKIELNNLSPGTTYSLKIRVRDEAGNETEENFPNFTTGKDENPPKIDQVRTDSALAQNDKVQTIISWLTDEPATTAIIYQEGRGGEKKEIAVNNSHTTSHTAVITTFKSGVVYYFNVKSVDESGNEAKSGDYALLTPKVKENIVQIIINNFMDIFGWTKGIGG